MFLTVGRCASFIKLLKTNNLYSEEMPVTFPFFQCLLFFAFSFFFITVQHFYEKLHQNLKFAHFLPYVI